MKRNKPIYVTLIFIIAVLILAYFSIQNRTKNQNVSEQVAKCIGQKATLYTQLGCTHCKTQEDIFGDNLKYIKIIDCFYERAKCENITATPTWEIDSKKIIGVKTIKQLRELTKC